MNGSSLSQVRVVRFQGGAYSSSVELVVPEHVLEVYLNDQALAQIACLGIHTDELAVGFLHTEGYIEGRADIREIISDASQLKVYIYTHQEVEPLPAGKLLTSSGARIQRSMEDFGPQTKASLFIPAERIFALMEEMVAKASVHQVTRGTHSAALADSHGIVCLREDIGRHNCLDMLDGYCVLQGIDVMDKCVLRTGRVSTEIVKKVARMGVKMVVSLSVPTYSALELARRKGIMLIGRVRNGEMTIYTEEEWPRRG